MKLTKKSVCALLGVLAVAITMSGCGGAKIGYVDGGRVMDEAPQIKAIITEGNQKITEAQEQAESELNQKGATATTEEMQQYQREAQQKLMSLNQQYSMQMKEKLDTAMAAVAQEKKLDAIMDNEEEQKIVLHGGEDVTDAVIAKLQ